MIAPLLLAGPAPAQKPGLAVETQVALETARRSAAGLGCAAPRLSLLQTSDLPPVTRDSQGRLSEGMVIHHFSVQGCPGAAQQNALLIARPGSPLRGVTLLPGRTLADPVLQRDTLRAALTTANARLNCPAAGITDTTVTRLPRMEQGRIVSPWAEEWLAAGCGGSQRIEVTFTPNPTGTSYGIRLAG